jgi:hypothetical protein
MTFFGVVIEKSGSIKEVKIKEDDEYYKKAGFKSSADFAKQTSWKINLNGKKMNIDLYGKTKGRAGQENKYEFPPPVDNVLYFGGCLLVSNEGDLNKDLWKSIYDKLYGGFEDLGESDGEDSGDDEDDALPKTKEGYAKNGFIVDDDDLEDSDYDDELSEEDYI